MDPSVVHSTLISGGIAQLFCAISEEGMVSV